MPEGAFEGEPEGSLRLRHRMIASKPVFILRTLEASPLPVAWLDVDLEFHAFPTLFTPAGWADVTDPRGDGMELAGPRDQLRRNPPLISVVRCSDVSSSARMVISTRQALSRCELASLAWE